MPHLDDGTIHELLDGEIPSSQLPPITAHLASCETCRIRLAQAPAMLAEADELIEVLDLAPAVPVHTAMPLITPAARRNRWIAPLAWAASLVIAAGAGYAARNGTPLVPPPTTIAVTTPSQATDAVAQTTTAPAPIMSAVPPTPISRNTTADKPAALPTPERASVAAEQSRLADASRERTEPAAPAAVPPAGAGAIASRDALSGNVARRSDEPRSLAPTTQTAAKAVLGGTAFITRVDTIALPEAMRLLGGRIRLINGLVPLRLESQGTQVRVIYPLVGGELALTQRLVDGQLSWRLVAPTGFPADSLDRLRAIVHE